MLNGRGDFVMTEVRPAETNAEISGRRFERQANLVAGMEADPHTGDLASECALCVHERLD